MNIYYFSGWQLREHKEVENVVSGGNQVLHLKVWSHSNEVGVVERVLIVSGVQYYSVILVVVLSQVELWVLVGFQVEEDVVEYDLSEEHDSSLLVASPPWSK